MDLAFFSREKIKRDYDPVRTVMNYREKREQKQTKRENMYYLHILNTL